MRSVFVGLAVASVFSVAGSALADGQIWFGTDPSSSSNRYNGTDSAGGAFVITTKQGYNGLHGGNRTAGDNVSTANVSPNLRYTQPSGNEFSFLSFCIERNEFIANGGTYWTEIATSARFGGAGGGDGQTDPLGPSTAWLYREFRRIGNEGSTTGLFNNIFGSTLESGETSALQSAIWFTEGELQWSSLNSTAQSLVTWANGANNGQLNGVRVLRLWETRTPNGQGGWNFGGQHQDQLTLIPLPPAAWAGLSTLAGVGFVGVMRRRSHRA